MIKKVICIVFLIFFFKLSYLSFIDWFTYYKIGNSWLKTEVSIEEVKLLAFEDSRTVNKNNLHDHHDFKFGIMELDYKYFVNDKEYTNHRVTPYKASPSYSTMFIKIRDFWQNKEDINAFYNPNSPKDSYLFIKPHFSMYFFPLMCLIYLLLLWKFKKKGEKDTSLNP